MTRPLSYMDATIRCGGINMKKLGYLHLLLLCFIFITASCRTKNPPVEEKNNNPSVNSPINNNQGTAQSIPEIAVPDEPQPEPPKQETAQPPITESNNEATNEVPKKVTQKKTALGSYKTPLLNKTENRVYNIKRAAKKINGYKLRPRAIFSFNDVVGKRDAENGFKVANVIIKGEYSEDIGGGVCQLSSTLYNAVDKAKLEIIERHAHSRTVGYLPEGRDAAVSYGYLDLRFKNSKDYPIEIKAWVENNEVHVTIYRAK